MKTKFRIALTLAAAVLIIGLFSAEPAVSVLANTNCVQVQGRSTGIFNGVSVDLTFTGAGILNGTGEFTFDFSSLRPTADANSFTYLGEYTINTQQGQVKLNAVALDTAGVPFIHTDIAHVNPNTSTGRFAGATGVIFTKGDGASAEHNGEICFATN
ncbi:MAG TPA: hypothetical protein VFH01_13320 [Pyrinomonadaceae bacterium]|nr:hypothetical protein [Pyrinomonadaceae bacterium]